MIKKIFSFLIIFNFTFSFIYSQEVEELVSGSLSKRGNIKKLEEFKTMVIRGQQNYKGMDVEFSCFIKKPSSYRMETEIMSKKTVFGMEGDTVWQIINGQVQIVPETLKSQIIQGLKELEGFMKGPLLGYKEKGKTVELAGIVNEQGREAYTIKQTDDKIERFIYLDKNNLELFKIWLTLENTQGEMVELDMNFENYKDVDGILFPHDMEYKIGNQGKIRISIEDIKLNTEIDDLIFKFPGSVE
jgi:outer membrane lipoprotein-sorting protein